jgi:hypothetical protein
MYKTSKFVPVGFDGRETHSYLTRTTLLVLHVRHNALQSILAIFWVVCSSIVEVCDSLPLLQNCLRSKLLVDWEAVAACPLPACSSDPTAADFEESSGGWLGDFVRGKGNDQGCYVVGLESLDHFLWHDCSSHGSTRVWSNGIDVNVVFCSFTGQGPRETEDTAFLFSLATFKCSKDCTYGRSVVSLSEVAINTTG